MPYDRRSDEDLKQLALDIVAGHVFTSNHMKVEEIDAGLMRCVFMPLVFLDEEGHKEMADAQICFLYEYYSKAGPRGVNGYPTFFSMSVLDREDADRLRVYGLQAQKMMKGFTKGE